MNDLRLNILEKVAASLLSAMAIIVSVSQCEIAKDQNKLSKEQTTLMQKQTEYMQLQTENANKQLVLAQKQIEAANLQFRNAQTSEEFQKSINEKQVKLLEEQTKIASKQLQNAEAMEEIRKASEWDEFKITFIELITQRYFESREELRSLTKHQAADWFKQIQVKLESQLKNRVLIQDQKSLGDWRHATEIARMMHKVCAQEMVLGFRGDQVKSLEDSYVYFANIIHEDVTKVGRAIINDSVYNYGNRTTLIE